MSNKIEDKIGSAKANKLFREYIEKQIIILSAIQFSLISQKGQRWKIIPSLFLSIMDSCDSLLILSKSKKGKMPKMRDCLVISRTILESTINVIFILAKGKAAVKQAEQHRLQKCYRDLKRELNITGQVIIKKWTGKIDLDKNLELKTALKTYSSKKGREITSWSPESLEKRLELIHLKYGSEVSTYLKFALFFIYRHASEIIHGTFYGAIFMLGGNELKGGPNSPVEMEKHQRVLLSLTLQQVFLTISSLIKVMSEELAKDDLERNFKIVEENSENLLNSLFNEESLKI